VAALILFLGVTAAVEMPRDIFPEIDIPVVSVIWQYTGLNTTEVEQRFTTYSQYTISSNVNGINDIEAETENGISVQKIYFQRDVNLDLRSQRHVSCLTLEQEFSKAAARPGGNALKRSRFSRARKVTSSMARSFRLQAVGRSEPALNAPSPEHSFVRVCTVRTVSQEHT
jgi:multidrug efflux pump subunit AcrB